MTIEPALYAGTIRHRRFAPRPHEFRYSLFMALLDIDRIDELMAVSLLTSANRWNLASYYDRDHIGEPTERLRDRLRSSARDAGHGLPDGPIYLLTHLRYAGYVFNPISIYYCFDPDLRLRLVLADVRNTYGGRQGYWLTPLGDATRRFRAVSAKALYVSPFMTMNADYEFLLTVPAASLVTHMNVIQADGGGRLFDATLELKRRSWSARELRRALLAYPLMTARVIGAIHFEALRLHLKGLPTVPRLKGQH